MENKILSGMSKTRNLKNLKNLNVGSLKIKSIFFIQPILTTVNTNCNFWSKPINYQKIPQNEKTTPNMANMHSDWLLLKYRDVTSEITRQNKMVENGPRNNLMISKILSYY